MKKKCQPSIIRRRKLFGSNNVQPLFVVPNVSPASSSSLSRTPINNKNKSTSNSNRPSPAARSTIPNMSSTLEKSSTDDDGLESDDYSTDEENEENLPTTHQVHESGSDMDDEVQILLNNEKTLDLDQLQIKYDKLQDQYKRLKNKCITLKTKYKDLEQNTIRELTIVTL